MVLNDIRYALRLMRRSPGFTAVAVLSLALGIGANTAIFSLFHTVVLRNLPVSKPGEIVELLQKYPGEPRNNGWGWVDYEHFRDNNHVFSAVTGTSFDNIAPVRASDAEAETVVLENVLGNYFEFLGLEAARGRLIGPGDVPPSGDGDVVVVSWSFWNTRLHADPAAIGKRILVRDVSKTIIGVAPRSWVGPRTGARTDIWLPRQNDSVAILARLRQGVTIEQARAEMPVLFRFSVERRAATGRDPLIRQVTAFVEPAGAGTNRVRDLYGKPLALLMFVVALLLLLACTNLAGMLLARAASRQREMAVRIGLGAGRRRLMRQMLTESLLLSGAGALVGVLFAYFGTSGLVRIISSGRAHERVDLQVQPDLTLLLFTAGIAVLTGVLFGLAPAWYAFRTAPATWLRHRGGSGDTWFWRLFGKGLVAGQVALSILLVTSAAVFLNHLSRMRNLDLGFRSDHVLLVSLDANSVRREQLAAPYRELLSRLGSIPGVRSAAIAGCTPIQGCGASRFVTAEGFTERREDRRFAALNWVSPRYFESLRIPLIAGRDFTLADAGRSRVAIISESMARYYFPGRNPIGMHVKIERDTRPGSWFADDRPYEIIGVAGDAKYTELRDAPPRTMYMNMFQDDRMVHQFVLRTQVDPESVVTSVRRTMQETLGSARVTRVTTLSDQVDAAIVPERLIATLSGWFGLLGAVLAGIGLYGLLAYSVTRRLGEIGVRIALGATSADVRRLIARDAAAMLGGGLAAGLLLVLWSRPVAARVVQDLKPDDPASLVMGGIAIVLVAIAASYLPARRAARVDPVVALRQD